jgi:GntR family transcriptional regulator
VLDEGAPIFSQVAARLIEEIADGAIAEGGRVPSTNELAARRKRFTEHYVEPLVTEAKRLGIGVDELVALVQTSSATKGGINV